jgi:hypothetical protein
MDRGIIAWRKMTTISLQFQETIREKILAHVLKQSLPARYQIEIHFKSQFCYIDAHEEGEIDPIHLCRLGFRGDLEKWDLAFYTYSTEKYQACAFPHGEWQGTPEEGLEVGLMYLI